MGTLPLHHPMVGADAIYINFVAEFTKDKFKVTIDANMLIE
jgi:hypothetical protein